ncbi:hypothetical protein HMPREF9622_02801 [Cutibacterium modestum HL037PA3]|nr:hypothetical protein HMPREF9622_02801 [Cutibacterium modestum HL037PA3]
MSNLRWHRTSSSPRLPHAVGESWEERGVGEIMLEERQRGNVLPDGSRRFPAGVLLDQRYVTDTVRGR